MNFIYNVTLIFFIELHVKRSKVKEAGKDKMDYIISQFKVFCWFFNPKWVVAPLSQWRGINSTYVK